MRRLILALPFFLALAACDSSDVDNAACAAAGITSTGSMRALAAGESFSAACVDGRLTDGTLTVTGLETVTGAGGATQRQITLLLPSASAGQFSIPSASGVVATYADIDLADPTTGTFTAVRGMLTVEELSATSARGSFSFTGRGSGSETVEVRGGTFDVTF